MVFLFGKIFVILHKFLIQKIIMRTVVKRTESTSIAIQFPEPKRLSKAGLWMKNNPGGIIVVLDRRAVNK